MTEWEGGVGTGTWFLPCAPGRAWLTRLHLCNRAADCELETGSELR